MSRSFWSLPLLAAALITTACGGEGKAASVSSTPAAAATPGVETPAPGGKVVVIEMITDGDGNYFTPVEVTVKRGDVLRFTLVTGVHNASWSEERNPGITGLPASTPLLQLPGQTYDIKVDLAPGTYTYHCDPHWALGMIGRIVVTE